MGKKKPGLTINEHLLLGRKIKELNKLHKVIINEVWRGYGKSCPAGVAARSIVRTGKLQSELDNKVCRETRREDWERERYGNLYFGPDINENRKRFGLSDL